jgi:hypothetical protein
MALVDGIVECKVQYMYMGISVAHWGNTSAQNTIQHTQHLERYNDQQPKLRQYKHGNHIL